MKYKRVIIVAVLSLLPPGMTAARSGGVELGPEVSEITLDSRLCGNDETDFDARKLRKSTPPREGTADNKEAEAMSESRLWRESEPVTSPLNMVDNDVYLATPGLIDALTRYRAGEPDFDPLPDYLRELEESPHIPTTHALAGMHKLNRVLYNKKITRYDKEIVRHFRACLKRARRAKKTKKLRHAGMYYEAACRGGLASFYVARRDYIRAGTLARKSIKGFFKLHGERPDHHGTLVVVGAYNYFTSRLGTLGKILLRLLALPVGEREPGLRQLYRAAEDGSPFDVVGKMVLIPALMYHERNPDEAIRVARELAALVPKNPMGHLVLSMMYLLAGRLTEARECIEGARGWQPEKVLDSPILEARMNAHFIELMDAGLKAVLDRDDEALKLAYSYCSPRDDLALANATFAMILVGHIFKLADYDGKADAMYERVVDSDGARELRDRAEEYRGDRDIRKQIVIGVEHKRKLREWLKDKPLPPEA